MRSGYNQWTSERKDARHFRRDLLDVRCGAEGATWLPFFAGKGPLEGAGNTSEATRNAIQAARMTPQIAKRCYPGGLDCILCRRDGTRSDWDCHPGGKDCTRRGLALQSKRQGMQSKRQGMHPKSVNFENYPGLGLSLARSDPTHKLSDRFMPPPSGHRAGGADPSSGRRELSMER